MGRGDHRSSLNLCLGIHIGVPVWQARRRLQRPRRLGQCLSSLPSRISDQNGFTRAGEDLPPCIQISLQGKHLLMQFMVFLIDITEGYAGL